MCVCVCVGGGGGGVGGICTYMEELALQNPEAAEFSSTCHGPSVRSGLDSHTTCGRQSGHPGLHD